MLSHTKYQILFFILFTCFNCMFSQNIRITYEYKSIQDTLKREDVKVEIMYLDACEKYSYFYNHSNLKLFLENKNNPEKNKTSGIQIIKKDRIANKIYDITELDGDLYKILDNRNLKWVLIRQNDTIGIYKTQKAETFFAGRKWIAWFTTEIPFQEGPYKFAGLPGTIVKIQDEHSYYKFEITRLQILDLININNIENQLNTIKIKQENYRNVYKNYRNDPIKKWRGRGIIKGVSETGKEEIGPEILKNMERYYKAKLPQNILEKDLIK